MPVLAGTIEADITHLSQRLQLSQLVVLQLEQGLPPRGVVIPLSLLEKEAKVESTRSALLWQRGQEASLSHWLTEHSSSNFKPHLGQAYSYSGIFLPLYD